MLFIKSIMRRILCVSAFRKVGNLPNRVMNLILNCAMLSLYGTVDRETSVLLFDNKTLYSPRFSPGTINYPLERIRDRFGTACEIYVVTDMPWEMSFEGVSDIIDIEKLNTLLTNQYSENSPLILIAGFQNDETLDEFMGKVIHQKNVYYFGFNHVYPPARYLQTERNAFDGLRNAEKKVLEHQTEMNLGDYENIVQALSSTRALEGVYIEVGVFRGNSAVAALEYLKISNIQRYSYFFDTFEGFTYETAQKSQDARFVDTHFKETSFDFVMSRLEKYQNCTVQRLNIITDDLPESIHNCAVANIDVDSFEATESALQKISPLMVNGGIMILEDYGHTPATLGGFFAIRQFLRSELGEKFTTVHLRTGQLFLIKYE